MSKYIFTFLASSLLLASCLTTPLDIDSDDKGVNEITESNDVFTIESTGANGHIAFGGIDEYVELIQNPEAKDLYTSEAAPENYEASDYSWGEDDNIQKYTESNPTPDLPLSGLDLIFYLKETSADGTEIWYGPFQGLMQ